MGINRTSFYRMSVGIVFVVGFSVLLRLGFWQLSRMAEKKAMEQASTDGYHAAPVPLLTYLSGKTSYKPYQPVLMPPLSLLKEIFLLDNQVQQHQSGYRVFHLARAKTNPAVAFLIEGAWLPYQSFRQDNSQLEHVMTSFVPPAIGYVRFPSTGLQLRRQAHDMPVQWPLVLQWIDPASIGQLIGQEIAPFLIQFDKPALRSLSHEKHLGYAVQWFLFAGLWAGYGIFFFSRRLKGVFL